MTPKDPAWNARKETAAQLKARLRSHHRDVPMASTPREAQLLGDTWIEWRERPHGFRLRQQRDVVADTRAIDQMDAVARYRASLKGAA